MNKLAKSTLPSSNPIGGIRMSLTNEVTIFPKAAPMIIPIARSITFPRITNSLNSFSIASSFFTRLCLRIQTYALTLTSAADASNRAVSLMTEAYDERGCGQKIGNVSSTVGSRFRLSLERQSKSKDHAIKGDRVLSMLHRAIVVSATLAAAFLLVSINFTTRTHAQFHPIAAPGYEINLFADPINVPEFVNCLDQSRCYTGPLAIAFDSRGRLFVTTGGAKVLMLLDNDEDGRADQVKTFATGLPQPFGIDFRSNGDLYVTSNIVGGVGRVIRLRDTNGDDVADESTTIIDNLPSQGDHQTTKLKFGSDGLLYVGQGSFTDDGEGPVPEGPL